MKRQSKSKLVVNRKYSWYQVPHKDKIQSGFFMGYVDKYPVFRTAEGTTHVIPPEYLIVY